MSLPDSITRQMLLSTQKPYQVLKYLSEEMLSWVLEYYVSIIIALNCPLSTLQVILTPYKLLGHAIY